MSSIKEAFVQDHKIIDGMLNEFIQAQRNNQSNRMELFNDLRNAINKHQKEEELYQLFKQQSTELNDVIRSVRTQHEQIIRQLNNMCDVEDEDEVDCNHLVNELLNIIKEHEKFEEQYLYEEVDKALDEKDKERIIYNLQSHVKTTR